MKLFGLRKCSTCRKAAGWLDAKHLAYSFSDVRVEPVTTEQVAQWSRALGGWEKLINRAGYTWRGLAPAETKELTESRAIALAVKHPSLVRRPLIEHDDGRVTVGFSKKVQELFG